jgi:hypothetical protein
MISPCYFDCYHCHVGYCSSAAAAATAVSAFQVSSLLPHSHSMNWNETDTELAGPECEHLALAPRARGKWVVSSVSVRVQSKATPTHIHIRLETRYLSRIIIVILMHLLYLYLYPIIATFFYAKRILRVVCAVVGSEISWRDARDSWTPDIACDDLDLDSSPNYYLSSGRVY